MERRGVHHVGLATLDIDRTIDFYTKKLGMEVGWCDIIEMPDGGKIKHVFFDTGDGTFMAFMCPDNVKGVPQEWATDINSAQGLPGAFYHFALYCENVEALARKREELLARGVDVTAILDHEWCHSIYFRDPNGLLLEYCATVRPCTAEDKEMKHHDQPGFMTKDPVALKHANKVMFGPPPNVTTPRTPV
jgi:catechol 2,3-dioxygenase-like lactoylglutathione lyase family enzyme